MKNTIGKIHRATDGKKTAGASVIMMAFQVLILAAPKLISSDLENIIEIGISSGAIGGVFHKVVKWWKERKKKH